MAFNEPLNPLDGRDIDPPPQRRRGFFGRLFSNKHNDAFRAFVDEQRRAGKTAADIDWRAIPESQFKAAYRRKYGKPFPE